MNEKTKLWPEQYVNRKVQQHDAVINALISQNDALTKRVESLESIVTIIVDPEPKPVEPPPEQEVEKPAPKPKAKTQNK